MRLHAVATLCLLLIGPILLGPADAQPPPVTYHYVTVDGLRLFYREAGDPKNPTVILLHGFPASSHMFRDLMPDLADRFHLIAPDYPGFGYSAAPPAATYTATFANLGNLMADFLQQIGATRFILYMQDFGGPVGMYVATSHPAWVSGVVIQNTPVTNDGWIADRLQAVLANAGPVTPEKRAAIEKRVVPATAVLLYQHGARNPGALNPDAWTNDSWDLTQPENVRIMTDMQLDIPTNVAQYPMWQAFLRQTKPRMLVVWGDGDAVFAPAGADAFKTLVPSAEVYHLNTGHFALEEDHAAIAQHMIDVFGKRQTGGK
jgi:pimeloyl-ACP methyl ester carboxylesterase